MNQSPSVHFGQYWSVLRRRWLVIGACLVLGLIGAGLVLATAPKRYVASCDILVLPLRTDLTPTSSTGALAVVNLDTEAEVVRSAPVLDAVSRELGGTWTAARLAADVRVAVPANTTILSLSFPAASPDEARRAASAFARAYLANRTADGAEVVASRKKSLQLNIDALRTELQRVAPAAESSPNPVDRALAEARRDVLMRQLNSLTTRYQRVSTQPLDPGRIVREPSTPTRPESPVPELVAPSGLIAGLLVGIVLAVVRDRLDRRVRAVRPAELAPLLGRARRRALEPIATTGPAFEEVRRFGNQLLRALDDDPALRVVLVLPVGAQAGALTAQLAVVAARSGRRTLLIPAGTSRTAIAARPAEDGGPEIGLPVVEPGDSSPTESVRPLISAGRQSHDLVLVEAPPVGGGSDAQTLASWSDGVVVVFEPGLSRRAELAVALRQLDRVDAPVLGSVAITPPSWLHRAARPTRSGPVPAGHH